MQIRPNGQVKSGKHQGAYIYLHVSGSIELHSYKLNAGFFTPNSDIPICTLNSGNVDSFQYLGKETKTDDEGAIRDTLLFGVGAGMISSELSKKDFHQLILTYTDKSTSYIEVDTEVYAKLVSMINAKQQNSSIQQTNTTGNSSSQQTNSMVKTSSQNSCGVKIPVEVEKQSEATIRIEKAFLPIVKDKITVKDNKKFAAICSAIKNNRIDTDALQSFEAFCAAFQKVTENEKLVNDKYEKIIKDFYAEEDKRIADTEQQMDKELSEIKAERDKLGLFAGKEKKALDQKYERVYKQYSDTINKLKDEKAAKYSDLLSQKKAELQESTVVINQDELNESLFKLADSLSAVGLLRSAYYIFKNLNGYKNSPDRSLDILHKLQEMYCPPQTFSAGPYVAVAIQNNNKAIATKYVGAKTYIVNGVERQRYFGQDQVQSFDNLISIAASRDFTCGLDAKGFVRCTGKKEVCNTISSWSNVVGIRSSTCNVLALKNDGTAVAATCESFMCDKAIKVKEWRDVIAITASNSYSVAITVDGQIITTDLSGLPKFKEEINKLNANNEIYIDIADCGYLLIPLRYDGKVCVARPDGAQAAPDLPSVVLKWENVKSVHANSSIYALSKNGSVYSYGEVSAGDDQVAQWENIIAFSAGSNNNLGLTSEGTLISTKYVRSEAEINYNLNFNYGQCDIDDFNVTPAAEIEAFDNSLNPAVDGVEEIKRYKELLDMGIINQEEFNAKKKELLGL